MRPPRQGVVVSDKQGEDEGGDEQPGGLEAVVPPKNLLAVLLASGEVENAGVYPGHPGYHHAEHDPLQQEAAEAVCLPEHDFGQEIEKTAPDHGAFVPQPVGQDPPGHLQQDAQSQGDALNEGDLGDRHALRFPVEGGHRAVKDHALQEGDGVHTP